MRTSLILVLLLIGMNVSGQTLEELVNLALANNPGLQAREIEVEVVKKRIDQVALPDPQINAAIFLNPMMLPMGNQLGNISVMQMFPWFGALDAMKNEVNVVSEVKQQSVLVGKNELIYKVKSAWYPLLELDKIIAIRIANLKILDADKELATSRFQYAKGPMVDVIRADIMIDELRTEISLLEQKRQPLQIVLNRLLNRAEDTPILQIPGFPETELTIHTGAHSPVENNPVLLVFDKQIEMSNAEAITADFQRKPMIGAGLQYMPQVKRQSGDPNIIPNTGRDMVMPMFSVTIPIWKKKYDAAVAERQLMKDVYTSMKVDMKNELSTGYEMTRYEMDKMQQMMDLLDSQMTKTQQAIELVMGAYQNGEADFEEVLRLQQQVFKYQIEKVSAQTGYYLAQVKLNYLTGN